MCLLSGKHGASRTLAHNAVPWRIKLTYEDSMLIIGDGDGGFHQVALVISHQ